MNRSYPRQTAVRITSNGNANQAAFDLDFDQDVDTPDVIAEYLRQHEWSCVGTHPDTAEDLWQHKDERMAYGYYKWEQAVAFQMFLFMNLGP